MNINTLTIEINKPTQGCELAILKIDDREFLEIVKEVEFLIAHSTGEASLAGAYEYLPLHLVQYPSNFLLGGNFPSHLDSDNGKRSILECTCGCPGCWPLRAKITVDRNLVIWSEFEQPHRENWRYPETFQFIFSRSQMEHVLRAI